MPSINPHYRLWERYGASAEIVSLLRDGIPIDTLSTPPPARPQPRIDERILKKLPNMIVEGVLEQVHPSSLRHSAPLFTVPKGDDVRVIHDLRALNRVTAELRSFRLFGLKRAVMMLGKNDFMIKIDMHAGYHQVGVRTDDRNLLGVFLPDGRAFRYRGLGFGWRAAPFFFQRITTQLARIVALRHKVTVSVYLDDFLISNHSKNHLTTEGPEIIRTMQTLGVIVNTDKSDITPSQRVDFLGITLDTASETIRLPQDKATKYKDFIRTATEGGSTSHDEWLKLLGRLSFFASTARHALLQLRPLQAKNIALENLPDQVKDNLQAWMGLLDARPTRDFAELRSLWGHNHPIELSVAVDAAEKGWGACAWTNSEIDKQGVFPAECQAESINVKELFAIREGLRLVGPQKTQRELTIYCDNTTAVSWTNKQGSTKAPQAALDILADLYQSAEAKRLNIRALHTPGHTNVIVDRLSRGQAAEWATPRAVLETIQRQWGPAQVDATASPTKELTLPGFVDSGWTFSEHGLSRNWNGLRVYAAPPLSLLGALTAKLLTIRETRTTVLQLPPRQWRSCVIVVMPNIMSPEVRRIRGMTRHKLTLTIHAEHVDTQSELGRLVKNDRVRFIAAVIPTRSRRSSSTTGYATSEKKHDEQ